MKQSRIILFSFLLLLIVAGCKKDPQEIFNEQKSGVVLICNEFYYDVTLADGEHFYFTGIADDGSLQGSRRALPTSRGRRPYSMARASSSTALGAY